jgi:Kef-type K+ transport system membrane component KefB/Trk K+ transport system NAD-binding subunit
MSSDIFGELSIVIVIVTLVSLVMRLLKQPLILGYIVTGILVGPSALHLIHAKDAFEGFANIGIALLLFIIGLGMNIAVIRRVGKPIFITAAALLVVIGSIGALVSSTVLGLGLKESYIIGLALFFSSTIIIVKVLTDKKEQNRLYGQIAIGVIILDDLVATLALLFVAAGKGEDIGLNSLGLLLAKGLWLLIFLVAASRWVLPRIVKAIATNQESLFLFAVAWGFGVASLFQYAGFSIEVGSLFAGVSLAGLPYAQEIESRLKPLRDFFIVLFFITLGESLSLGNLQAAIVPSLVLSFVVIVLKPAAVTSTLGLLGYPKRVAFKAGINLSQISEFSIVLIVLATANGLVSERLSAITTLVAMITITSSTYLMQYDNKLFLVFDKLKLFNGLFSRDRKHAEKRRRPDNQLILFGYNRGGHEFIRTFKNLKKPFLVVDYDPGVIETLQHQQIPCLYGDATDTEMLEEIGVQDAKLIVSTLTDTETNQELVRHINFYNPDAVIVCNAEGYEEAMQLYELGCSYVMIPHHASSERLSGLIAKNGIEREHFDRYRAKHLQQLEADHPLELAEDAV